MRIPCIRASSISPFWRAAIDAFAAVIVVTGVTTHRLLHLACLIIGMLIGVLILAVLKEPGDLVDTPPAKPRQCHQCPSRHDCSDGLSDRQPEKHPTEIHHLPLVVDDGAALRTPQAAVVQHDHVITATLRAPVVLAFIGVEVIGLCLHRNRGRFPSPSPSRFDRDQRKKVATLLVAQRAKPGDALMAPALMIALTALAAARPVRMSPKSIALLLGYARCAR
ncbi:hypothetical protein Ddc_18587 [Ditylenchus destructor]|nr:hypothetical protein Ddc_18587 [Ditylenchus destructor]